MNARGRDRLDEFLAHPRRAVWTVSAPMMAGMVLQVLFMVVETAFIGRLGPQALAATTLIFPLFFTMIAIVMGVGTGITVLVAQAIGRRDLAEAERVGGTAIALGVVLGSVFAAGGVLGGPALLHHLGASAAVADLARDYFLVLALSAPVVFVGAFLAFLLNGEGDARTPMLVRSAFTGLNVALDWLFLFRLGQGIRGAALAGAVCQVLQTVVLLYLLLWRRGNLVKLHVRSLVPSMGAVRSVMAVGIPNSLAQLVMAFGAMLLNRAVASFGESALAAMGVGQRVDQIATLPVIGLASGTVAVIGMFAGAGRADLVRQVSLYAMRWAVGLAAVVGALAFAASGVLLRVFTTDAQTLAVGRHYLLYMVFAYPMMASTMLGARILLGLGYPNLSLGIVSLRLFALAVPIAYVSVFVFHGPIDGIWWGLLLGSAASTVAAAALLRLMVWTRDPTARATRSVSEAAA